MATTDTDEPTELIARNKRARHDYEILDTWECGVVLTGTEVKALREGRANLTDAFGVIKDNEVFLLNLHIGAYGQGNVFNHEPTRTRKLLMHKDEIRRRVEAERHRGRRLAGGRRDGDRPGPNFGNQYHSRISGGSPTHRP